MAAAHGKTMIGEDRIRLGPGAGSVMRASMILGVLGLAASAAIGYFADEDHSFRRALHAYVVAYGYFLSIGLGALFFVVVQHLTKAGWSVNVRRIAEALATTLPVLAVLAIPLVLTVLSNKGTLYPWAVPVEQFEHHIIAEHDKATAEHPVAPGEVKQETLPSAAQLEEKSHGGLAEAAHKTEMSGAGETVPLVGPGAQATQETIASVDTHGDAESAAEHAELVLAKRSYLNPGMFTARMVIYLVLWSLIALFYWRQSVAQDADGEVGRTLKMQTFSPVSTLLIFLSLTFASVDILMSLDPTWYSTIFGIYYFAGAAVAFFATMSVICHFLQGKGYLLQSIKVDHYHDLGKFLFAMVFFWGYIAFAQYMLLWYGNIPEEIAWWARHGATTVPADMTVWTWVITIILIFHVLIPFGGLLSRHVKRNKAGLIFWSVWMLVMHYIDIHWVVMPQLGKDYNAMTIVLSATTLIGVGGVCAWAVVRAMASADLRPVHDPRLAQSMAFTNF